MKDEIEFAWEAIERAQKGEQLGAPPTINGKKIVGTLLVQWLEDGQVNQQLSGQVPFDSLTTTLHILLFTQTQRYLQEQQMALMRAAQEKIQLANGPLPPVPPKGILRG